MTEDHDERVLRAPRTIETVLDERRADSSALAVGCHRHGPEREQLRAGVKLDEAEQHMPDDAGVVVCHQRKLGHPGPGAAKCVDEVGLDRAGERKLVHTANGLAVGVCFGTDENG